MKFIILFIFSTFTKPTFADLVDGSKFLEHCGDEAIKKHSFLAGQTWLQFLNNPKTCRNGQLINSHGIDDYKKYCIEVKYKTELRLEEECKSKLSTGKIDYDAMVDVCLKEKWIEDIRECAMIIVNKEIANSDLKECIANNKKNKTLIKYCLKQLVKESPSVKEPLPQASNCLRIIGDRIMCDEGVYIFAGDKLSLKVNDTAKTTVKDVQPLLFLKSSAPDTSKK